MYNSKGTCNFCVPDQIWILISLFISFFKLLQNVNNRDSGDARWRPGTQGRGIKGGRPNFSARYTSHGKLLVLRQLVEN